MTAHEHGGGQIVRALVALQFSRMYRPLRLMMIMTVVLLGIDIAKHGFSVNSVLPWVLGSFMMAPLIPCFALLKERNDGSLRYVASLPVSESLHGMSRATTAFILSVPSAVLAAYALNSQIAGLPLLAILLSAVVFALASASASLCLLATQLRLEVGEGFVRVLWVFPAIVAGGYAITFANERGWLAPLRSVLSSPVGLMAASIALWSLLGIAGYVATRAIGRGTVLYRGEPAKA